MRGVARARGIVLLIVAHRNKGARHAALQQLHRGVELRLAGAEFDRGLVALHARAAAAGEHQPVDTWNVHFFFRVVR